MLFSPTKSRTQFFQRCGIRIRALLIESRTALATASLPKAEKTQSAHKRSKLEYMAIWGKSFAVIRIALRSSITTDPTPFAHAIVAASPSPISSGGKAPVRLRNVSYCKSESDVTLIWPFLTKEFMTVLASLPSRGSRLNSQHAVFSITIGRARAFSISSTRLEATRFIITLASKNSGELSQLSFEGD